MIIDLMKKRMKTRNKKRNKMEERKDKMREKKTKNRSQTMDPAPYMLYSMITRNLITSGYPWVVMMLGTCTVGP